MDLIHGSDPWIGSMDLRHGSDSWIEDWSGPVQLLIFVQLSKFGPVWMAFVLTSPVFHVPVFNIQAFLLWC